MTKPISDKQLIANRINAKKWWVKTEKGKEISKMNSLKYWVYSPRLFDGSEQFAYRTFIEELIEEYKPNWLSEETLICQIALYEVKLHRILYMEEYFNLMASFENIYRAERECSPDSEILSEEQRKANSVLYDMFMNASNILKIRNFEEIESMQKYRDTLENRKAKCINELMKIKFMKKSLV